MESLNLQQAALSRTCRLLTNNLLNTYYRGYGDAALHNPTKI